MLFRSKKKADKAQSDQASGSPRVTQTATGVAPVSASQSQALSREERERRAQVSKRAAATVGDIVGLLAMSPRHADYKLSDLRWLVLPAVRTGQFAMTEVQSASRGTTYPVATVLWASVSADVDRRISGDLSAPLRLAPKEWRSGDTLWLVDAVGDEKVIASMMTRLRQKEWKGRIVKVRVRDADGKVKIKLIEPTQAGAAAASPMQ
jgi:cytolysin-activating lysine-acyltransferase